MRLAILGGVAAAVLAGLVVLVAHRAPLDPGSAAPARAPRADARRADTAPVPRLPRRRAPAADAPESSHAAPEATTAAESANPPPADAEQRAAAELAPLLRQRVKLLVRLRDEGFVPSADLQRAELDLHWNDVVAGEHVEGVANAIARFRAVAAEMTADLERLVAAGMVSQRELEDARRRTNGVGHYMAWQLAHAPATAARAIPVEGPAPPDRQTLDQRIARMRESGLAAQAAALDRLLAASPDPPTRAAAEIERATVAARRGEIDAKAAYASASAAFARREWPTPADRQRQEALLAAMEWYLVGGRRVGAEGLEPSTR